MKPKVLVIVGPTASGKTGLSIELAKIFNSEIISGDSIQQYKGLDIGSGKVTVEQMQGIVHHLIDIKDFHESSDVASFQQYARACIDSIAQKGKLPIVCGGTGLYIKALLYDYTFSNEMDIDQEILKKIETLDNSSLHQWLNEIDPVSALAIHKNNRIRVQRALMIGLSQAKNKSEQEASQSHAMIYDALILCLKWPRDILRKRISSRVDEMVQTGLQDEIDGLIKQGVSFENPCMKGIGYKEFKPYIDNEAPFDQCVNQVKTHSYQFAKRQETFFKHQFDSIEWIDMETLDMDNLLERIKEWMH